jgi:hypothetical protein
MSSIVNPEFIENMKKKFRERGMKDSIRMVGGPQAMTKHFFDGDITEMLKFFNERPYFLDLNSRTNIPQMYINKYVFDYLGLKPVPSVESQYYLGTFDVPIDSDNSETVFLDVFSNNPRMRRGTGLSLLVDDNYGKVWMKDSGDEDIFFFGDRFDSRDSIKLPSDFMVQWVHDNIIRKYNL